MAIEQQRNEAETTKKHYRKDIKSLIVQIIITPAWVRWLGGDYG